MLNKPTTPPFAAGDLVRVFASSVSDYGYEAYSKNEGYTIRPPSDVVGMVGKVESFNDLYSASAPDVTISFEGLDDTHDIDVCFLVKVNTAGEMLGDEPRKPTPLPALTPQCRTLLKHLMKGHSITQRSALLDFGVAALPRRVADLKENGYPVTRVLENNKLTRQRYARYYLPQHSPKAITL